MSNFLEYLRTNELTIYEGLTSLAVVDTATELQNLKSTVDNSSVKIDTLERNYDDLYNQFLLISRELDSFEKTTNTNFLKVNTDISALDKQLQSHLKDYDTFKHITQYTLNVLDSNIGDLTNVVNSQQGQIDDLKAKVDDIVVDQYINRFGYQLLNYGPAFKNQSIWVVIESPDHPAGTPITPGNYSNCKITGVDLQYTYYGGSGSISVETTKFPSATLKVSAKTDYFTGTMFLSPS